MRLLLDTHIILWAITDSPSLPRTAAMMMREPGNDILASSINLWEIAVKFAVNRGLADDMPVNADRALELIRSATYELLPVEPEHAVALGKLPLIHRDPFDRLLVAQALHEGITLLTSDRKLAAYGDFVMVV